MKPQVEHVNFRGHYVETDEGDVLPLADFDTDEFPSIPAEIIEARGIHRSIEHFETSKAYDALRMRVERNRHDTEAAKEVRALGGMRGLRAKRIDELQAARLAYLRGQGIEQFTMPVYSPDSDYDTKVEEFHRGTIAWLTFRTHTLDDDNARTEAKLATERTVDRFIRMHR